MSFATYSDLQAAIASRIKRTDLTAKIPDYIALAEIRIRALLDNRLFESTVTLSTGASSDVIALPSDYRAPIALWIADINPQQELTQVLPQELPFTTTPSRPLYWAIDNANIRFQAPSDGVYPIKFRYQQTFTLSDANPTNAILTEFPDTYFYGALCEAADDTWDDAVNVKWDAKFRDAIQRANDEKSSDNRFVPLLTEFAQIQQRRFNVYRGY